MNVIAFLGSPRVDGNSALLLKEAVRAIEEEGYTVRTFNLNMMNIHACQNCGGCDETGVCVIADDMSEISTAIRAADRIILASPIFFFGLSAQSKAMIDRCQSFWCEKYLLKKPIPAGPFGRKGLLLLVGGMEKTVGMECGNATATAFFRTISVPEHAVLSFMGVDARGAIRDHPTALAEAFDAGRSLVSV
ncbi:MAG: flavodoxin family protein [Nitrospiraceae bacterium]|nr:flavodoxin family protein [Nitrospiraceae bacterium]